MIEQPLSIPSWDEYFMRHVYLAASKSKDNRTKIGAVIVRDGSIVSEGYNGMCRHVDDESADRYDRPEKYFWFEHGERNAIYNAARAGIATLGAVMYTQGVPCADCARGVIQSGITKIYTHLEWEDEFLSSGHAKWDESCQKSLAMLREARIIVQPVSLRLGIQCLMNGKIVKL